MIETVVGGAVLAAALGAWTLVRRAAKLRLQGRNPIDAVVDPIVREPWGVALPAELPDTSELLLGTSQIPSREVHDWLLKHGGADHAETKLRIVVTAKSERVVVITDIRVEAVRDPPVAGTHIYCPTAGANVATLLMFDLDAEQPQAWEWLEDGARQRVGTAPYFEGHSVSVEKNEAHTFVLACTTKRYAYRWRIALDIVVGRRRTTVILDDHGHPFRTSGDPSGGFDRRYHWAWYEGGGFKPVP